MDDVTLKFIVEAVKGGYGIPVILWFLWDKGKAIYRKKTGKWVSLESIGETLDAGEEKVKALEAKITRHLEREAKEDISFAEIKGKVAALEDKVTRENEHLFNQSATVFQKIDKIHERFDKMDEKIDKRFDTLTQILLEKK